MPTEETVSLPYVQSLLEYLEEQGVDISEFLIPFGLCTDSIKIEGKRIAQDIFTRMFDQGETLTNDHAIGLHVGERIKTGHYGVLGYSVMSCTYMEEAILRQIRYQNLVADIGNAKLCTHNNEEATLVWETGEVKPSRHIAEHNVAAWVSYARWISGLSLDPLRIDFQHKAPEDITAHQQLFNCPIAFEQDQIAIIFSSELLKLPLPQKDLVIRDMMDKHAEKLLIKKVKGEDLISKVKMYISLSLEEGKCDVDDIAQHFSMSGRTLQRKLKEQQVSHQELLDDTREELAMQYIKDHRIDLSELAFVLGFSEQSSFQRAFKRWTNLTPGKYRDSH